MQGDTEVFVCFGVQGWGFTGFVGLGFRACWLALNFRAHDLGYFGEGISSR